jgi:flavin reductase
MKPVPLPDAAPANSLEGDKSMTQLERAASEAVPSRPVTQQSFRDAMSRLVAAVNVITTDGSGGRAGFTASAVCSVTDAPPTLLVCLNRNASASAAVHENGVLCVNVLSEGQHEISSIFGGKTPMARRFEAARWWETETGAPMLDGALAAFDCRIVKTVEVGTHSVLFCEIVGLYESATRKALIYFGRAYHRLALPE